MLSGDDIQKILIPFLRNEGISIYAVPSALTVLDLIEAEPSKRRALMWNRRMSIITDCERAVTDPGVQRYVPESVHAVEAIAALRVELYAPAQALLTAILDTLMSSLFAFRLDTVRKFKNSLNGKDVAIPSLLKDAQGAERLHDMTEALVWIPILSAFKAYYVNRGDPVPRFYNRHASVHAADGKQYVKRNAIQALMLAASLISFAARERSTA